MAACESGEAPLRGEAAADAEDRAENGARRKEIAQGLGSFMLWGFFCASSPARKGEERCVREERDAGRGRGWSGWGAGRGGSATGKKNPRQVRSYSARNDTSPPVAVPSARGGRRVRLAPANTGGDGYVSRYYNRHGGGRRGGGGQYPHFLRVTRRRRRSWHAPLLSSPHRRGRRPQQKRAIFKSFPSRYEIYFAAAVRPSHVTPPSAQEEYGPRRKETAILD